MKTTVNNASSFSRDYFAFSALVIALVVVFFSVMSFVIFKLQEKKRQEQVSIQIGIVSHELKKSLGNIENFFQFIGDKFVNGKEQNIKSYAQLFKHNLLIDSNFQNIYLSTFMNWVNIDNKIVITAGTGLLDKPITAPTYYPIKKSLSYPWVLIESKIQKDQKGYFIPTAMSITDDNGKYLGTIIADIVIESLQRTLNLSVVNKEISYIVIDDYKNILLSSLGNSDISVSKLNIENTNFSRNSDYNILTPPIKHKDIIFTAYKKTSLGFIILAGYSNTERNNEFINEIEPYFYIASLLTFLFLGVSYLFRNVKILPAFSILRNNLYNETKARQENERILTQILKNTRGFVYRHKIHDNNLTVEYISEGCSELTGYDTAQYLNKTSPIKYTDIIDPEHLDNVLTIIRKSIQENRPYEITYPIITAQGKRKWVLNQGNTLNLGKNNLEKDNLIEGMLTDITPIKETEIIMSGMLHDLALSNAELERFAHVCSHDLKEPLRTICNYIQFLRKDENYHLLSNKSFSYIEIVQNASLRMKDLIENILLYSKVGTQPINKGNIDINEVINDVKKSLNTLITETEAEIIVSNKLPTIIGDINQLRRLFQNLFSNGLKFYKKGIPPKITVEFTIENKEIIFCINDNGIGIDKEYYEIIFDLFSRLNTQDEYPGTGIGLAICKRIIERHHGKIWIASELGNYTKVYFTVPLQ